MTLSDKVWERFYEQFEVWVESRNISFLKNAHCYGLNVLYLFIRPGNLNLKISENLAALTFLREKVSPFAESKWYMYVHPFAINYPLQYAKRLSNINAR